MRLIMASIVLSAVSQATLAKRIVNLEECAPLWFPLITDCESLKTFCDRTGAPKIYECVGLSAIDYSSLFETLDVLPARGKSWDWDKIRDFADDPNSALLFIETKTHGSYTNSAGKKAKVTWVNFTGSKLGGMVSTEQFYNGTWDGRLGHIIRECCRIGKYELCEGNANKRGLEDDEGEDGAGASPFTFDYESPGIETDGSSDEEEEAEEDVPITLDINMDIVEDDQQQDQTPITTTKSHLELAAEEMMARAANEEEITTKERQLLFQLCKLLEKEASTDVRVVEFSPQETKNSRGVLYVQVPVSLNEDTVLSSNQSRILHLKYSSCEIFSGILAVSGAIQIQVLS